MNYVDEVTQRQIGKLVMGPGFVGRIVEGSARTGRWTIEAADGTRRTYEGHQLREIEEEP